MALLFPNPGDGLTRNGSFLDPAQNWTRACWVKFATLISTPDEYTVWNVGPPDFGSVWLWIGGVAPSVSVPAGSDPGLRLYGETFNQVTGDTDAPVEADAWHHAALTYTSSGTLIKFYVDGLQVGTANTSDLSAVLPQSDECIGPDGTADLGGVSVCFPRTWQAALSELEILHEALSDTPVRLTNLLAASTLADLSDGLTDTTGNGHSWVVSGTPEVTDGPAPSGDLCAILTCSTPPPIPVGAHRQWFLHRFDLKIRGEQTS